jgi:hypothetical protein
MNIGQARIAIQIAKSDKAVLNDSAVQFGRQPADMKSAN